MKKTDEGKNARAVTKSSARPSASRRSAASSESVAAQSSTADVLSAAGFHRIHCSNGTDALTIYLPLDEARKLSAAAPKPWLLKARLDDFDWYGELVVSDGKWNRIVWATDDPETFTDLGKGTFRVGALVRLRDEDDREWSFSVRHLARI